MLGNPSIMGPNHFDALANTDSIIYGVPDPLLAAKVSFGRVCSQNSIVFQNQ